MPTQTPTVYLIFAAHDDLSLSEAGAEPAKFVNDQCGVGFFRGNETDLAADMSLLSACHKSHSARPAGIATLMWSIPVMAVMESFIVGELPAIFIVQGSWRSLLLLWIAFLVFRPGRLQST